MAAWILRYVRGELKLHKVQTAHTEQGAVLSVN